MMPQFEISFTDITRHLLIDSGVIIYNGKESTVNRALGGSTYPG
jgi:hypothetical protein